MRNECCELTFPRDQLTIKDAGRVVKCHECGSTYIVQRYWFRDWLTGQSNEWIDLVPNVTFRVREKTNEVELRHRELIAHCNLGITFATIYGASCLLLLGILGITTDCQLASFSNAMLALLLVLAKPWN